MIKIRDPCPKPNTLEPSVQKNPVKEYLYTLTGVKLTVTPFIVEPVVCHVSYECVRVTGDSPNLTCEELNIDADSGVMLFLSTDMMTYTPGEYKIMVRGSAGFEEKSKAEVELTLNLVNPCSTANLM